MLRNIFSNLPSPTKSTESVLSNITPITSMSCLPCAVTRSEYMHISSKLLTTPTTNEDLKSTEDDICHVHSLDEIHNNITRSSDYLLIDSVEEVKDDLYKFTKVLEAFPQFNKSLPCCKFGSTNVLHIIFTKNCAEHSVETKDEIVPKLEEFMIPLHYYLEKADVRRVHFIFKNAKTDDELYSFKFPAIFTYRKCSGLKEYNLYHDTELSQAYRLEY